MKKGFAHIFLLIIVVLVGIIGIGYFAYKNGQNNYNETFESQAKCEKVTAKECVDQKCDYKCPSNFKKGWIPTEKEIEILDTSNWKTYADYTSGFYFKYPQEWKDWDYISCRPPKGPTCLVSPDFSDSTLADNSSVKTGSVLKVYVEPKVQTESEFNKSCNNLKEFNLGSCQLAIFNGNTVQRQFLGGYQIAFIQHGYTTIHISFFKNPNNIESQNKIFDKILSTLSFGNPVLTIVGEVIENKINISQDGSGKGELTVLTSDNQQYKIIYYLTGKFETCGELSNLNEVKNVSAGDIVEVKGEENSANNIYACDDMSTDFYIKVKK